jgi:hypothetical protein
VDPLGDHLCTCTSHSGAKKAHDWVVDQIADLFHTTHTVKTIYTSLKAGVSIVGMLSCVYLANASGPVSLVLDLRIVHDRFGSTSDPSLNGHLHYPNDVDKLLNEVVPDKIRKYRSDYNDNPPTVVSFIPVVVSTSGRLHSEFVRLLFLQVHRETDRFFSSSGTGLV